jgi:hypothetical protein
MASLHIPAARAQLSNVAGFTGGVQEVAASAKTRAESAAETIRSDMGGLGPLLFGHETSNVAAPPLERATNALRGIAGGLVPTPQTNEPGAAPATFATLEQSVLGIATPSAVPATPEAKPATVVSIARGDLSKLRSRLGL